MNTNTSNRQSRSSFSLNKNKHRRNKSKSSFGNRSFGKTNRRGSSNRFRNNKRSNNSNFDPSQFINKKSSNPTVEEEIFLPKHKGFKEFGLSKSLVDTLDRMNIKKPTPIQDKIIPEILTGKDVVGLAETGTGKTAAFLLPLIKLTTKNQKRTTLVVAPTRELAAQIELEFKTLSKGTNLKSVVCVGGVGIRPQISGLQKNPHFIIGTPGRLLDLINRGTLKQEKISTVILDEADRMLDMGFINDIKAILSKAPESRETHLFSATMADSAQNLVKDFLRNPIEISVKKKDTISAINQNIVIYSSNNKFEKLTETLESIKKGRIIIFGAMKHSVEKLSKQLKHSGYLTDSIHGNKTHSQRKRSLDKFKNGQTSILVATDVAARGIHVNNVSHVINYDLPSTFEDYIHRIGRTGRAQNSGEALTFVSEQSVRHSHNK